MPIVEPEIVPNGKHSIEVCAAVTEKVLVAQFRALALHNVYLEGSVPTPTLNSYTVPLNTEPNDRHRPNPTSTHLTLPFT